MDSTKYVHINLHRLVCALCWNIWFIMFCGFEWVKKSHPVHGIRAIMSEWLAMEMQCQHITSIRNVNGEGMVIKFSGSLNSDTIFLIKQKCAPAHNTQWLNRNDILTSIFMAYHYEVMCLCVWIWIFIQRAIKCLPLSHKFIFRQIL